MNKKHTAQSAFFNLRILITLLLCAVAACSLVSRPLLAFFRPEASTKISHRTLTFAERVAYQRAIEEVHWRHRIWPKNRPDLKPSLDAVMSQAQLEEKVQDYLRDSQMLEDHWQKPITAGQLQAEMDRMAQDTNQPEALRELFEALGNDPFVIAECLARPVLADRLVTKFYADGQRFHREMGQQPLEFGRARAEKQVPEVVAATSSSYTLPPIPDRVTGCTDDTWTATTTSNAPAARTSHTAIWTGTEMIVWGGDYIGSSLNTGGRYEPSTDFWTATSTTNAPDARAWHTAVWTGSEMIVWGGAGNGYILNTGGRYEPSTDSWTATSTANAPSGREYHAAVWTGSEMIVWGGIDWNLNYVNTGGRYDPSTDTWTATSITNAPSPRASHTAVWTGSDMIVWGGTQGMGTNFNTGGRYDPSTDTWTATSTTNAPHGRFSHTAIWTGSEMIAWGGFDGNSTLFNTGGRYDPSTDTWTATSITNAPSPRASHTAVWTGSDMIVWGGFDSIFPIYLNTGGRYDASMDTWTATAITNAPDPRASHTAVWAGNQMVIWGGDEGTTPLNTGGGYCAQPPPTPTPTPTPTPCTGRCSPTPRPRPTPHPRPTPPP